jgi:hypothetical protein
MTSIREAMRRLLHREVQSRADFHDSEFSYAVHWAALAREWDADRRQRVHTVVRELIARQDFVATEFERRYAVDEIGPEKVSGVSLVALDKVLASFPAGKDQEK